MHGAGKLINSEGDIYQGQWRNGLMHGNFKITFNSGNVFEGEFKNGQ